MALDRKLLDILCCPSSKQPLALLNGAELESVNRAIAAGGVRRNDGSAQDSVLEAALVTRDRRSLYRVEDGIPVLLADEAMATSQVGDFPR